MIDKSFDLQAVDQNQGYDYNQQQQYPGYPGGYHQPSPEDYPAQSEQHQNGHVQQPDLVAAAPPDTHPKADQESNVTPEPTVQAPQAPVVQAQSQSSTPVRNVDPGFRGGGPDIIANNNDDHEAPNEAIEPAQEAFEQQNHPFYEHSAAPDILNTEPPVAPVADRNLYMETGEFNTQRQPVDGGNEENNEVNNLPMDRLVLGESEPQRFIAGAGVPPGPEQPRSEAAGSAAIPPMNTGAVAPPPMGFPPTTSQVLFLSILVFCFTLR